MISGPGERDAGPHPVSAPLFHVFIERARATTPGAGRELARAIAARYGLPAEELEKRFAMGRFRVKGNVDRATADSYAADLESLGAVCTVVPAGATPLPAPTAMPMSLSGAQRVAAPPAPAAPSPPAAPPAPPAPPAFQDLGALSGEMPLTLATLDGASEDDARTSKNGIPLAASFGPPAEDSGRGSSRDIPLAASFGPPVDDGGRSSSRNLAAEVAEAHARSGSRPAAPDLGLFDPFAPPEMQTEEAELVLAVERRPKQSAPPPGTVAAEPAPAPEREIGRAHV